MEYLGNHDLFNLPKTAFLASSTIPTDMVLRCYDWAQQASLDNECIISGFSSHLEQRVLHFLMRGTCPIILVLARQMYKRVPDELQPLLDNGRLLIISTTSATRQSRTTAYARNRYICELSEKIILIGADEGSSLFQLRQELGEKVVTLPINRTPWWLSLLLYVKSSKICTKSVILWFTKVKNVKSLSFSPFIESTSSLFYRLTRKLLI